MILVPLFALVLVVPAHGQSDTRGDGGDDIRHLLDELRNRTAGADSILVGQLELQRLLAGLEATLPPADSTRHRLEAEARHRQMHRLHDLHELRQHLRQMREALTDAHCPVSPGALRKPMELVESLLTDLRREEDRSASDR